ncbi:synapsin-2-like [Dendronephthya gigantea]|uniref:synapsin-2-like n=1 Tax=Dendronephthya gigantea TaxID=151771 RepID=UPI0010697E98|nr:synapsin-2-like [Dendronephthya gigantea]
MDNFFTKLRLQTKGIIDNRSFNGTASRGNSPTHANSPQKHNPFGLSSQTPRNPSSKRNKIILVVDTPETDWISVFKDRQASHNVQDLRVEQAEFSELNLASYSDSGTVVDIQVRREGTVVVRSFRPDLILLRQSVRGLGSKEDWRSLLFGMKYGNIPSINSLESVFNFLEKPWVFAHLLQIQRKLGNDIFPLIPQAYYPNHKEMLITPKFPAVVKVGHANSGYGKVCVQNHRGFQDISSIVAVADTYATTEPFIEGTYDIRIQKIGESYRVFKRKSLSDNWKTNMGSAVVEEIQLTERYKLWADECAKMFGGLDILCVEVIQTGDGKEYIIEVNDTGMKLFSETRDTDIQRIADLTISRLKEKYPSSLENMNNKTASESLLSEALKVVANPTIKETKPGSDSTSSSTTKLQGHFSGIIVDN